MNALKGLSRSRLNVLLYLAVVLTACGVILLVLLQQQSTIGIADRVRNVVSGSGDAVPAGVAVDAEGEDLHASVLMAGTRQASNFLNVDYREIEDHNERVLANSTGDFAKEYQASLESLVKVTTENQVIQTARIVGAGVVAADKENATVLVAMEGSVQNKDNKTPQANAQRLQMDLVWTDGRWLTHDLKYVP